MELPFELQQNIVEFLISIPNIQDRKTRQALLLSAGLDQQLMDRIPEAESPAQFVQLLVPALVGYGTLRDGRNALTGQRVKRLAGPAGVERHFREKTQQSRALLRRAGKPQCLRTRLLEIPRRRYVST